MQAAKTRKHNSSRPKHKHTKEYLKHYHPFLPLLVSITALLMIWLSPVRISQSGAVLSYATNIDQTGLLTSTNQERIKNNVSELTLNQTLSEAAEAKAKDMVARNYWSHNTPDGAEPWTFIAAENYNYQKAGENLAFGFADSSSTVTGWMNSDSHRDNMLDNAFTEVGFGWANSDDFNNSGPSTVTVALYATPATESNPIEPDGTNTQVLGAGKNISTLQLFTSARWSLYAIAIILGVTSMYLVHTHTRAVRRAIRKGEKFIIHHPFIDALVVCIAVICFLLLRAAGSIL